MSRVEWLPAMLASALAAIGYVAGARPGSGLWWSFAGAAGVLLAWAMLLIVVGSRPRSLTVVLRKQHYLQACAQGAVLLYWGWYWRPVADAAPLIAAQLVFAYAFDMLLAWSRRDTYTLGFGPFPVVFSTNLFLWFKPEWFFLQFAMLAVGFAAKELIRWTRDGRSRPHLQPFVVSAGGLLTRADSHRHERPDAGDRTSPSASSTRHTCTCALFLVGAARAVPVRCRVDDAFGGGDHLPSRPAVLRRDGHVLLLRFLRADCGLSRHAPALHRSLHRTAHRARARDLRRRSTEQARWRSMPLLGWLGVPAFYDKLLQVPLLNLSVRLLDRAASSPWLRGASIPRESDARSPSRRRHVAYLTLWAAVFAVLSAGAGPGRSPSWPVAALLGAHACRRGGRARVRI